MPFFFRSSPLLKIRSNPPPPPPGDDSPGSSIALRDQRDFISTKMKLMIFLKLLKTIRSHFLNKIMVI